MYDDVGSSLSSGLKFVAFRFGTLVWKPELEVPYGTVTIMIGTLPPESFSFDVFHLANIQINSFLRHPASPRFVRVFADPNCALIICHGRPVTQ